MNTTEDFLTHSADPRSPLTSLGFDFHEDEGTLLGNIRYNKIDLMVDRVNEIVYQHLNIERGWFGEYPSGRVQYDRNESNPFLFLLNFDNLKTPLTNEEKFTDMYPYQENEVRKGFLASVSHIDDAVGRITRHLKNFYSTGADGEERSLFKDTVIIFTSLGGGYSSGPVTTGSSNTPLRGQHGDLLEGGCRVPGFITNINTSGRDTRLFHVSDWLPTLYLGVAGGHENDITGLDGVNQIDVMKGVSEPLRTEILYEVVNFNLTEFQYTHVTPPDWPENVELTGAFGAALRRDEFKLSLGCYTRLGCSRNYNETWEGNMDNDQITLINLNTDPEELLNLSDDEQYSDVLMSMKERLLWHVERAVTPLHADFESSGLPLYSFPPGQFYSGWCDDPEFDSLKNVTKIE